MDYNLGVLNDAVAAAIPDRECVVFRDRRLTWGLFGERSRRLANVLRARGLGVHTPRARLHGWQSGQDHLALYLYNGNEYLEGMLGAYKARVAPFNVNYRYVSEELVYLLRDSGASAIVYHASLAATLASVLHEVPGLDVLLQVDDDPDVGLLPGAVDYEDALAASSPEPPPGVDPSPDDLYILYTGGTTGMPKGVAWRQHDIFRAALGGAGTEGSYEEIAQRIAAGAAAKMLPAPPFMHGAAHWLALNTFHSGGTVVIPDDVRRFDPSDVYRTIQREQVSTLLIVGDAFARPMISELQSEASYDLGSLRVIVTGGAPLAAPYKQQLVELLPNTMIFDAVGSSETGTQGSNVASAAGRVSTGTFSRGPNTCVLSEDLTRVLDPGDTELGWLAQFGPVPLGYLGDEAKTRATFPVIDGVRYSVPGDRARILADGSIELHGRDSVTINSGGEKIFAEEVEHALKHHPDVWDVVVAGRPSERWGQEVVAIVHLKPGAVVTPDDLLEEAARHVARYKLPKAIVFRDEIVRSPSGKADYRWATEQAMRGAL